MNAMAQPVEAASRVFLNPLTLVREMILRGRATFSRVSILSVSNSGPASRDSWRASETKPKADRDESFRNEIFPIVTVVRERALRRRPMTGADRFREKSPEERKFSTQRLGGNWVVSFLGSKLVSPRFNCVVAVTTVATSLGPVRRRRPFRCPRASRIAEERSHLSLDFDAPRLNRTDAPDRTTIAQTITHPPII